MRRTEEFRSENIRPYKRESVERYDGTYGRGNCDTYRELTKEGRRFCAVAGLLEEIIVLTAFGIGVSTSPLPVLMFLWVLFVILTAATLIGASSLMDQLVNILQNQRANLCIFYNAAKFRKISDLRLTLDEKRV